MHCRGQIDYILTVRNRTNEACDLTIERSLEEPDGKEIRRYTPLPIRLKPLGQFRVPSDRLTYDDIPIEKPKMLKVRLVDTKTKAELLPEKYTFEQLRLDQYLNIESFQGSYKFPGDQDESPAYQIRIARKTNDPVTEPILCRSIRVSIDGQEPIYPWKGDTALSRILGDNSVIASYPNPRVRTNIPRTVEVGGQAWTK